MSEQSNTEVLPEVRQKTPETVDEAVEFLLAHLDDEDRKQLSSAGIGRYHLTTGMLLRNHWSLWKPETPLVQDFRKRFKLFGHADDVSGVILECLRAAVQGKNWKKVQSDTVERYRRHWRNTGFDPETGEQVTKPFRTH